MILAVGLDLCDVDRVEAAVRRHPRLLDRVFTPAERAACERKASPWASYAARFAAKEAAMKALGTGWGGGVAWRDLEVTGGAGSPPGMAFHGAALRRLEALGGHSALVSLTHERRAAAAVVILLGALPRR
ncbi:MAG: holo-ACP synthase [Acidobacteriota bacterium]